MFCNPQSINKYLPLQPCDQELSLVIQLFFYQSVYQIWPPIATQLGVQQNRNDISILNNDTRYKSVVQYSSIQSYPTRQQILGSSRKFQEVLESSRDEKGLKFQNFIEFHRISQNSLELYRISQNFLDLCRTSQNFIELPRTLSNFLEIAEKRELPRICYRVGYVCIHYVLTTCK